MIFRKGLLFRGDRSIFTNKSNAFELFYNEFFDSSVNATATVTVENILFNAPSLSVGGNANTDASVVNSAIVVNAINSNGFANANISFTNIPIVANLVFAKGDAYANAPTVNFSIFENNANATGSANANATLQSIILFAPDVVAIAEQTESGEAIVAIAEMQFLSSVVTASADAYVSIESLSQYFNAPTITVKFIDISANEKLLLNSKITNAIALDAKITNELIFVSNITNTHAFNSKITNKVERESTTTNKFHLTSKIK